ncbi:lipopolysaccharide biosynthesis protein [Vagococcus sp.]|uniref:lipopolysaccharide biosynthesis protein n=1 Tax=Vagococcus sp. TaxID=1933889 RepID=UPI003F9CC9C2
MNSQIKSGAVLSYLNIFIKNIISFMYTPFLLKFVGQDQYGLFQMTNSVILSLGILSMGLSSAYVKFYISFKVKEDEENINKLNALYLIMFTIISILALIIGIILSFNVNKIFNKSFTLDELELTKILMFILTINLSIAFISSVFDSNIIVNEKFRFQQIRQLIQSVLVPIISVPLILLGGNILVIGVSQTIVTIIFLIMNIEYCRKHLFMKFEFKNLTFALLKPLFIFSFYILLNQIVDMINNNAPSFIIGMIMGAKSVATFSIAIQIKNMFFMLSTALSSLFVPRVNKLVNLETSKEKLTDLMIKVGRLQMSLLFFILGGFIIVGPFFIEKWAGTENKEAYILIILMVLPSIIPLSQNIGIEIQRAMNKHIFRSISYSVFAILNIIVTIIGTNLWGIKGATLGYILSITVANGILMNWYYHFKIKVNMIKYWMETIKVVIPFIVSCVFMGIIVFFKKIDSIYLFLCFGFLYIAIYSFIFYFFTANEFEKKQLKSVIYLRRS